MNLTGVWGIPDWRDEKSYPPIWADLSIFAWEFFRRGAKCRQQWCETPDNSKAFDPASTGWHWDVEANGKRSFCLHGNSFILEFGELEEGNIFRIPFLLGRSFDKQIPRARKLFTDEQQRISKRRRIPREILPRYLQVLDAFEAEETPSVIATALFPHPGYEDDGSSMLRKLRTNFKQAKEIRDGGWAELRSWVAPLKKK